MFETASGPEAEPPRVSRDADATRRPDFHEALMPQRDELRCSECGYGVIAAEVPAACPMCQASSWEAVWREAPGPGTESEQNPAPSLRTQ